MLLFLLYYTLVVLLVIGLSAAACLSVFFVFRRRIALIACAWFIGYFFDVALVLQTDVVTPRSSVEPDAIYSIVNPAASIVFGALWVGLLALIVAEYLGLPRRWPGFLALAFIAISAASLHCGLRGSLSQFLFYSVRSAAVMTIFAVAAIHYLRVRDPIQRQRLRRLRTIYFVLAALGVLVVVQNVIFQRLINIEAFAHSAFFFFPERNFAENAFMLTCAGFALYTSSRLLRLRREAPVAGEDGPLSGYLDKALALFSRTYGLTKRETEVVRRVLEGETNREIAEAFFVAEGTVKTHVHNILKKTGAANRAGLIEVFWKAPYSVSRRRSGPGRSA